MRALEEVFAQTMSRDMGFDYSGMSFQEQVASQGVPATAVIGFSVLVVFLLMAALYESWTLPFAVLLATPIAMFGALGALWLRRFRLQSTVDLVTLIPRRDRGHETSRLCLAMPGDGVGCCGSALRLHGGTKLQAARGHHACGLAKRPGAARLARRSRMVGHFPGPGAPRAAQHRRRGQPRRPGRGGASPRGARTARSRARPLVRPGQCRRPLPGHQPRLVGL